jgi:hypothetical protein
MDKRGSFGISTDPLAPRRASLVDISISPLKKDDKKEEDVIVELEDEDPLEKSDSLFYRLEKRRDPLSVREL